MSFSSPIIRISRKRSADPQSALIVEAKRQKNDLLMFSLFKTSDAPLSQDFASSPVIDFKQNAQPNESNPLAFASNLTDEFGGQEPPKKKEEDTITLNGRPLIPAVNQNEDIVYDFYKIVRGEVENVEEGFEDWCMRFATKEEEEMLVIDEGDTSDDAADDDDDSNDENNWRNDYPDEESFDAEDSESERYYANSEEDVLRFDFDRFRLRSDSDVDSYSDAEDSDY